jgi:hypothetical protein
MPSRLSAAIQNILPVIYDVFAYNILYFLHCVRMSVRQRDYSHVPGMKKTVKQRVIKFQFCLLTHYAVRGAHRYTKCRCGQLVQHGRRPF